MRRWITLNVSGSPRFVRSFHGQRSARPFRMTVLARAESDPRSPLLPRIGFQGSAALHNQNRSRKVAICKARERPGVVPACQRRISGPFVPPTCSDGPTLDAPDCNTDPDLRDDLADATHERRATHGARFGIGTARRFSLRPSPHPRIRWTVPSSGCALRACRPTRSPPPRVSLCRTKC